MAEALPLGDSAKGFIRPLRRTYIHLPCGQLTVVSLAVAERLARNPQDAVNTFCCHCKILAPVAEFAWKDGHIVGT